MAYPFHCISDIIIGDAVGQGDGASGFVVVTLGI